VKFGTHRILTTRHNPLNKCKKGILHQICYFIKNVNDTRAIELVPISQLTREDDMKVMIDNFFLRFKFSFFQYPKYKVMGSRKCLLNLKMRNSNIFMIHSTVTNEQELK